ncbi:hypothetical protein [Microbacterium sp.]|uniref:hypothetical protein n=1 Tax=Microbacterium sp. TaxID=51671 RepID=UPI0039E66F4D
MNVAHTLLSEALDAAGVYVGMTRGRDMNRLHVVASDLADAKQQFVDALARDRADRGLEDATERAREAVADLVADGPMSIVSAERDRIVERIAKADAEREQWVLAAARLHDQSQRHKAEYEPQRELAEAADAKAAAVLADVVESLTQEAVADGATFLAAQQNAIAARRVKEGASRFRKRSTTRTANDADARREEIERAARGRWQSVPGSESNLPAWSESVAQHEAGHVPAAVEARAEATQARQIISEIVARQSRERMALYERVLGSRRPSAVSARVKALRERAAHDRRYLAQLDALLPDEAVKLVHERAVQAEAPRSAREETRKAAEARAARLRDDDQRRQRGPSRDVGRRL